MYINTITGQYPVYDFQIKELYPNTSFPTPFVAPEEYALVLPSPQPSFNAITQSIKELEPEQKDGLWYQVWEVYDLGPKQVADNEAAARSQNKAQAASLLSATDWTTIPDVGNPNISNPYLANVAAFVAYRNQVRGIAVNPPVVVDPWPTQPDEQWSTA